MVVKALTAGDRIVLTRLPGGFIFHIETVDGLILGGIPQVRDFDGTIAEIRSKDALS